MRRAWAFISLLMLSFCLLPFSSAYSISSQIQKEISGSHQYGIVISKNNVSIPEIKLTLKEAYLDCGVLIRGSNVSIGKIEILGSGTMRYAVEISHAGNVQVGKVVLSGPHAFYFFRIFQAWGKISVKGSSGRCASTAFNIYYSSSSAPSSFSISITNSSFVQGSILDVYSRQPEISISKCYISLNMENVSFETTGSDVPLFLSSNVPSKIYLKNCSLTSQAPSIEVFQSYYLALYLRNSKLSSGQSGISVVDSSFVSIYLFSSKISAPRYIEATSSSIVSCYAQNPSQIAKYSSPYVTFYMISGKIYLPWHPKIRNLIGLQNIPEAAGILATILVVNVIGLFLTRIGKKY